MFDLTDSIAAGDSQAIMTRELYRRAKALDGYERDSLQNEFLRKDLSYQLHLLQPSTESLFDFLSDKLTGLFGRTKPEVAPNLVELYRSMNQFIDQVRKTYADPQWVRARVSTEGPILLGAKTREWMWQDTVVQTVHSFLPTILKGLSADLTEQGPKASQYLSAVRTLEDSLYSKAPMEAYKAIKAFQRTNPAPLAPVPFNGPFLGNYKVTRVGGWWSIELHPKKPELPKEVSVLSKDELLSMGNSLVELLRWCLAFSKQEEGYQLWLMKRSEIYQDERRRVWWNQCVAELGKSLTQEMFSAIDPEEVLPPVLGLIPWSKGHAFRYAQSFFTRMQKSIK